MNIPHDNFTDCTATFDLTGSFMVNDESHRPPVIDILLNPILVLLLMHSLLSLIASQQARVKASPFRRQPNAQTLGKGWPGAPEEAQ